MMITIVLLLVNLIALLQLGEVIFLGQRPSWRKSFLLLLALVALFVCQEVDGGVKRIEATPTSIWELAWPWELGWVEGEAY